MNKMPGVTREQIDSLVKLQKIEIEISHIKANLSTVDQRIETLDNNLLDFQQSVEDQKSLINELKGNYTILIVTHNMQQAARVSDYTAFMYLGRLVEYGPTDDIFQKPHLKETTDYLTGRFG